MADKLNGYRILILETREEAQFSRLLTEQGADVLQCPMFTIHDAPDAAPIEAWIRRCIEKPCDDLVLMTGEGLRRLMKVARRIELDHVLPYVYDAQAADANIVTAIDEMAQGRIDAIALTNLGQVRRLVEVARARGCEDRLREGLARTPIASVGPVVSDELKSHGLRADISPANDAYFMKPLISAMAAALGQTAPRSAVIASEAKQSRT